jgi:hypothetical protein
VPIGQFVAEVAPSGQYFPAEHAFDDFDGYELVPEAHRYPAGQGCIYIVISEVPAKGQKYPAKQEV